MITIFNRKELLITRSLDEQARVRAILHAEGIDYDMKTRSSQDKGLMSTRRGHTGSFGMNMDVYYEYRIFVKKEDYARAEYLLRNKCGK